MWQSEEKDMKENYKFLVSLRKQIGFGSEKQYLQTGNPSNIPNPIHTLEKKNMDASLLIAIFKCVCSVNLLFVHIHMYMGFHKGNSTVSPCRIITCNKQTFLNPICKGGLN